MAVTDTTWKMMMSVQRERSKRRGFMGCRRAGQGLTENAVQDVEAGVNISIVDSRSDNASIDDYEEGESGRLSY